MQSYPQQRYRERLERCFNVCARRAWRVAYVILRDDSEAFDAVQQAFCVAARKPDRVPEDDPWPWFCRVVVLEAKNLKRKKRPLPMGQGPELGVVPMTQTSPETLASQREEAAALWEAVDTLPPLERQAVVLTHIAELTHAVAAQVLEIPRPTLTARVQRALEKLRKRLHSSFEPRMLAALPVAEPPGGWEVALGCWRESLIAAAPTVGGAAGAQLGSGFGSSVVAWMGSVFVMSKMVWVGISVVVLASIFAGGYLTHRSSADSPTDSAAAGHGRLAIDDSVDNRVDGEPDPENLGERLRQEQDWRQQLLAENQRLKEESAALQAQLDAGQPTAAPGPVFTFGEAGKLDAVLEADWREMAESASVVQDAISTLNELAEKGETPDPALMLQLQEHTERMRKYEYRTLGKLPTAARHNGELTHPISLTNLFATMLQQAGVPLSDSQVQRINQLGEVFEADLVRLQQDTGVELRVRRVLDEYLLKGAFVDQLYSVLRGDQKSVVVNPRTHRRAFLDLYCPSLMIIHTSPIITGGDVLAIRGKMQDLIVERYGLDPQQQPQLEPLVSAWAQSCDSILEPVPQFQVRHYTYEQGIVAGEATATLLESILGAFELTPENEEKLKQDPAFFIPRRVMTQDV